jgi:hypothetical protein
VRILHPERFYGAGAFQSTEGGQDIGRPFFFAVFLCMYFVRQIPDAEKILRKACQQFHSPKIAHIETELHAPEPLLIIR